MQTKYRGKTERGRIVLEDSLQQCTASLAALTDRKEDSVITVQAEDQSSWYVYDSQASADEDAIHGRRDRWFAKIFTETQRG